MQAGANRGKDVFLRNLISAANCPSVVIHSAGFGISSVFEKTFSATCGRFLALHWTIEVANTFLYHYKENVSDPLSEHCLGQKTNRKTMTEHRKSEDVKRTKNSEIPWN